MSTDPVPHGGDGEDAAAFPLPPHQLRHTDTDPRAARRSERQVAAMFGLSALATVGFVVAYVAAPIDRTVDIPLIGPVGLSNLLLGVLMGLALFLIGAGAIHWAKKLMSDEEVVEERHDFAASAEERDEALAKYRDGAEESGIKRRPLIRNTLIGAMALAGLPPIVLLRDLGPLPHDYMFHTFWGTKPGLRILNAYTLEPLRPEDFTVGTLVSAIPEGLTETEELEGTQNERAKAAVILVRMDPGEIVSQQGDNWDYSGILCFSKICTHVGCPISLYEQQTHHLLCPCHQSTFDLADSANVVFGPAARRLPQLAITVDEGGYLVNRGDFAQPVGPSFWERG